MSDDRIEEFAGIVRGLPDRDFDRLLDALLELRPRQGGPSPTSHFGEMQEENETRR